MEAFPFLAADEQALALSPVLYIPAQSGGGDAAKKAAKAKKAAEAAKKKEEAAKKKAERAKQYASKAGGGGAKKAKAKPAAEELQMVVPAGSPCASDDEFQTEATQSGQNGRYYITTAISYTNGMPHMGHAYEALTTDAIARWHRIFGRKTYFLTGTDEHGQKIANSAEKEGIQPIDICNKYAGEFQKLNALMNVKYNAFIRTTQPSHHKCAQELWKRCAANGDIYLDTYIGWYLEREEMFVSNKDAEAWDFKDPVSGAPLKEMEEESYFFRLSKYKQQLLDLLEARPDFIAPEDRRKEIIGMLTDQDLADLSISRTKFSWGIPMPEGFDQKHVMYVWFDALSNYMSGVQGYDPQSPLSEFWPAQCHIIGKDIIRFHCIYWPAMLMSAGLPLPQHVYAHGFIQDKTGQKMSKSLGNVIDPNEQLSKYPRDTFRFYLCMEAIYGSDLKFSEESMVRMHNGPLADTLGNLVHRATNMSKQYADGIVPAPVTDLAVDIGVPIEGVGALIASVDDAITSFNLSGAIHTIMEAARNCNNWLQVRAPWLLKDPSRHLERQEIVRIILEAVYVLAHLFAPFLPEACTEVLARLNTPAQALCSVKTDFANLTTGTTTQVGPPLFAKLAEPEEDAAAAPVDAPAKGSKGKGGSKKGKGDEGEKKGGKGAKGAKAKAEAASEEETTCDFAKLDIRVGELVEVWNHPKSTKLFCEKISCGDDEPREVCSGLRDHFTLEQMKNKRVLVCCNLKPAKMADFVSNGMVLCAKSADGKTVEFIDPPADVPLGTRILPQNFSGGIEPYTANQVKKKKVLEAVMEAGMVTDGDFVATWNGEKLLAGRGGEVCKARSLANAHIS